MENLQSDREEFRMRCQAWGCKFTSQRYAVYCYIRSHNNHPSVNQVWEHVRRQLPKVTRESIFRILSEFADNGLVRRMDSFCSARFDTCPVEHSHLVCEKCGAVIDLDLPMAMTKEMTASGFVPHHVELRVSGLCAACAAKGFLS